MKTVLFVFLLSIGLIGTLGEVEFDDAHNLTFIDLRNRINMITKAAEFYLDNGVPSIVKLFTVDNTDEIQRLEGELKKKILEDLLDQLVEVWAEMNVRILKGFRVLKALRDKAECLVRELKRHNLIGVLDGVDIKERIAERVKELLKNAKEIFCVQEGNLTGLALAEAQLQNLTSRLEYNNVKNRLLKTMYSYGKDNLLNTTSTLLGTQDEAAIEKWRMARDWAKWAILGTMVFIKEPLHSLHSDFQQYVADLFNNIQELTGETLDNIFDIAFSTDDAVYRSQLLEILMMVSEDNVTIYC